VSTLPVTSTSRSSRPAGPGDAAAGHTAPYRAQLPSASGAHASRPALGTQRDAWNGREVAGVHGPSGHQREDEQDPFLVAELFPEPSQRSRPGPATGPASRPALGPAVGPALAPTPAPSPAPAAGRGPGPGTGSLERRRPPRTAEEAGWTRPAPPAPCAPTSTSPPAWTTATPDPTSPPATTAPAKAGVAFVFPPAPGSPTPSAEQRSGSSTGSSAGSPNGSPNGSPSGSPPGSLGAGSGRNGREPRRERRTG